METTASAVRGFSFMPTSRTDVKNSDPQFIECDELERAWRNSRRERTRQQEQKIWNEFVMEQDIIDSVCSEDPYQFIENPPEGALQEILMQRIRNMNEDAHRPTQTAQPEEKVPKCQDNERFVTFVEESDKDDDMFLIFDDEADGVSGPEVESPEGAVESACTVRENAEEVKSDSEVAPEKETVNVSSVIENSIYCAKVKDTRNKIAEELLSIMSTLEIQDIQNIDPSQAVKLRKRATEFCTRFNRVHLYQLQRQWQDIKRCSAAPMPFAMHTHFQAQMMRAVSLHQNLLAALQVYHKSIESSSALDGGAALSALIQRVHSCSELSALLHAPPGLPPNTLLCQHDIKETCERLENALSIHAARVEEYFKMNSPTNVKTKNHSKKPNKNKGKIISGALGKYEKKTVSEARLSMYSVESLRHVSARPALSRENPPSGGTSKELCGIQSDSRGRKSPQKQDPAPVKTGKISPSSRLPLMRGMPRVRAPRLAVESEIHTMVENESCQSSHVSPVITPRMDPQRKPDLRSKQATPRNNTPRLQPKPLDQIISLHEKPLIPKLMISTKACGTKIVTKTPTKDCESFMSKSMRTDVLSSENSAVYLSPVSKIQFEKKVKEQKEDAVSPNSSKYKSMDKAPKHGEVSRLLQQLCGGDASGSRNERVFNARNVQLLSVKGSSPRQNTPSTSQLLKILEETIQKKLPKSMYNVTSPPRMSRFRMPLNIPDATCDSLFQYRTKFVQHMLDSAMYANCAVGKPWEVVGSLSEEIIDELLLECTKEMQLENVLEQIYKCETT